MFLPRLFKLCSYCLYIFQDEGRECGELGEGRRIMDMRTPWHYGQSFPCSPRSKNWGGPRLQDSIQRNFSPQETGEISVDMGRIWYRSEEWEKLGTILFTLLGLSDPMDGGNRTKQEEQHPPTVWCARILQRHSACQWMDSARTDVGGAPSYMTTPVPTRPHSTPPAELGQRMPASALEMKCEWDRQSVGVGGKQHPVLK